MTPLILLYCSTYVFAFTIALGSEDVHRVRAATTLTVTALILLTFIVVLDKLVDL